MQKTHQVPYQKIQLPFKLKRPVLALGGQAKNTLCFAKGNSTCFSPIHPDLNIAADLFNFEKDAKKFLKKRPAIIACDLHLDYQSTGYAQNLSAIGYRLSAVQHHHAHIASCMAEHGLKNQKVIGAGFDGTAFGSDNTLWGAEFLICDYKDYKRAAHLKEVPLLGGERAISEPWRVAAAWLYSIYKDDFLNAGVKFTRGIDKKKWRMLKGMYSAGLNCPLASSMGRLFDAAGAIILAKYKVNAEAELAMGLEKAAMRYALCAMRYRFNIIKNKDNYLIDPVPMFKEIILNIKAKEPKEKIAYRFHLTIAEMIKKMCLVLRKKTKINKIVLSGGVFQNTLLLRLALDLLYKEGFKVFTHKKLSSNDSCISLGQAVIAGFLG